MTDAPATPWRSAGAILLGLGALLGTLVWAAAPAGLAFRTVVPLAPGPSDASPTETSTDTAKGDRAGTSAVPDLDQRVFEKQIVRPGVPNPAPAPQPEATPPPPPKPPTPPPLDLLGFVEGDGAIAGRRAILYEQELDLLQFVGVGERVGASLLIEIDASSVRVEHDGHEHVLTLRRGRP